MQAEVDMHWSELLMVMTEDDNGRIRASEEKELMHLWLDEFFIKLVVFKQRLEKRAEATKQTGNQ